MRDLKRIETDFTAIAELNEPQRTRDLVTLMNELEQDYGAFIFNPSQTDLERSDVQLYKKISLARDL